MAEAKKPSQSRRRHKATTPEALENQLISKAYARAEELLDSGKASQQLITHFLKLGATREHLEKKMLIEKTKLISAKVESEEASKRSDEMYEKAIEAMRRYQGHREDEYE